ncbi:nucleotidyltransferase domain-containing protein [Elusimicrobiota bacterium]
MENLNKLGIIEKSIQGNRVYYKAEKACPIFNDLKKMFLKCTGIAEALREKLLRSNEIKIAFIYGSYARGEENLTSDIDLFVIGKISSKKLSSLISAQKRELMREINYMVIDLKELKRKIKIKDHFLYSVVREKKIFIIGSENELKEIIRSG